MNMKLKSILLGLSMATVLPALAQAPVYLDANKPVEERVKDALSRMTLEEKVAMIHAQSKFSSPGVSRLGIPEVWTTDGPHGIRPEVLWDKWNQAGWTNDSCMAYPALTCLSATWSPEMSYLYGKSIGEEARYRKKDILLGPVKELKAFQKVRLSPGEEKAVTLTVDKKALSFFDDTKHEWIAEPGKFEAVIGSSSRDIKGIVPFELK